MGADLITFAFLYAIMVIMAVCATVVVATIWIFVLGLWTRNDIPSALATTALLSLAFALLACLIGYAFAQSRKHWVDMQALGWLFVYEVHLIAAFNGFFFGWTAWKSGRLYAVRPEPVAGAERWSRAGLAGMAANGFALAVTIAVFLASAKR